VGRGVLGCEGRPGERDLAHRREHRGALTGRSSAMCLERIGLLAGLSLSMMLATLPAASETIQLEPLHGIFMVPVRINDAITIPFVLDRGASEVVIPADVLSVLRRAGTISQTDFI
jgi:hypothetical protein